MDETRLVNDRTTAIRILIAEDSAIQAEALRRVLAREGYTASVAKDGAEGLAKARELTPDLVISDILMPKMDGFELCSNIKANERLRDTPFILLTSLSDPQDVIRAVQCGADQFVTKPYDEKHLLTTIEHLLLNKNLKNPQEIIQESVSVSYKDETYLITSNRLQILNLLLSTYETAMAKNVELVGTQDELKNLNKELEGRVQKRTEALSIEVAERRAAEVALQAKNEELNAVLQQLWQAAKLATMGELAASIAHELNNPLATVSLRIESLTAQTPEGDSRRRELAIIGQEVERMGILVANLLQFSRRGRQQISTLDVCEEIEKTLELINHQFRNNNIRVVREFAAGVPRIFADRQQLRQLFLNLFTNAGDAMPGGGTLTIRVYAQGSGDRGQGSESGVQESGVAQAPEPRSLSGPEADPRSPTPDPKASAFVVIEIADTGTGIPPEILPKVMEPFFTTKPEGKGTGLGLAICRRIAQEHGGTFSITSEGLPGKGTKVCITLLSANHSNSTRLFDK
ncbi:MAG: response regulator [Pseudomonadota bacterium]